MPIWLVKATWIEDDAEVSEQWQANADTAHEAVKAVATRLRFRPHHVEARLRLAEAEDEPRAIDLRPGDARRLPRQ
jgi:hypothetical protein